MAGAFSSSACFTSLAARLASSGILVSGANFRAMALAAAHALRPAAAQQLRCSGGARGHHAAVGAMPPMPLLASRCVPQQQHSALRCCRSSIAAALPLRIGGGVAAPSPPTFGSHACQQQQRAYSSSRPLASAAAAAAASAPAPLEDPASIPEVWGRLHSTESFSAVDGPGVRFVAFLQGCAMRCAFCSNPDSWAMSGGEVVSSKDLASQIARVLPYLKSGGGGLTCSGGEPLLQPEFTAALFREAHALGLTTTLDTTGQGTKRLHWDAVLPHTDGVLFCVKALDPAKYEALTGLKQAGALRFADELAARRIPYWLRYVFIPGHTDGDADVDLLARWAAKQPTLAGVELLPYHLYGRAKWEALGLAYPLEGVPTPAPAAVRRAVARLEAAGLKVLCEGAAPPSLSAAHTGAHS